MPIFLAEHSSLNNKFKFMHKSKPVIIIVGAYPNGKTSVFGGVIYNCMLLRATKLYSFFSVCEFDITQKSIPPPHVLIRLFFSLSRIIRFSLLLLVLSCSNRQPKLVILFAALSVSFIEKSFFSVVCRLFGIKSAIYPLGCQLINDCYSTSTLGLLIRLSMRAPNFLFSQGSTWSNFFLHFCSVPPNKIRLLPSWTSTPSLLSHAKIVCNRVSAELEIPHYVYTGWLVEEKGLLVLLEAFKQFLRLGFHSRLSILGSGPLQDQIHSIINASQLADSVYVLGKLSHSDTLKFIASHADIFVLPSFNEGIPNSLIEATSLGIPSIVTNVGCISDYYPCDSVVYVEARSVSSLLHAMKICHDKNNRANLSRHGAISASTHFSTDSVVDNLVSFISNI
jgi:glycosyltransferase involved in cell wall biosynthesis